MRRLLLAGLAGLTLASLPLATASAQRWHGPGWYGGYYYDHDWGDGAALGAGLLAGALVGGAIAESASPPPPDGPIYLYPPNTRLGYCERHLPGFDVDTGSYIAPNGRRVRCP
jgi:hypothetical protein